MSTNKLYRVVSSCLLASSGLMLGFLGYEVYHTHVLPVQVARAQQAYDKQKNAYQSKYVKLEAKVINSGTDSKNPVLAAYANNAQGLKVASNYNDQFFKVLYTFENKDDYESRQQKLKSITKDDILKHEDLFGKPESVKEVSVLGRFGSLDQVKTYLISVDKKQVVSLAKVQYKAGFSGGDANVGTKLYRVTYDKATQKITDVTPD